MSQNQLSRSTEHVNEQSDLELYSSKSAYNLNRNIEAEFSPYPQHAGGANVWPYMATPSYGNQQWQYQNYYPPGYYPLQPPAYVGHPIDLWGHHFCRATPSPAAALPFKSYSVDRLSGQPQRQVGPIYNSPSPSPPGSPSFQRSVVQRSPSPAKRNVQCPKSGQGSVAGKPPRPTRNPKPPLTRAKTTDSDAGDGYLSDGFGLHVARTSSPIENGLGKSSKVPSLDSLYEQLKQFANSGTKVDKNLTATALALLKEKEKAMSYSCLPSRDHKPEVEERLRRLEGEKDSLQLQVSVLMEQIDAQSDKISEMEKVLQERSSQLSRTEELLQKELILRSQLETQKMELAKELSSLRLRSVSVEKENLLLRAGAQIDALESPEGKHMSPDRFGRVGSPDAASTPVSSKDLFQAQRSPNRGLGGSMDIMPNLERSPMMVKQPRTPPASTFRRVDLSQSMSGTLPRTNFSPDKGREGSRQPTPKRGVAFGKGFNFFRPADKRSCSAPNLAETERSEEGDDGGSEDLSPLSPETPSSLNLSPTGSAGKNKGIRKLFGRMRRSSSSAFEEPEGAFKRGGVRATAGPRLGWGAENRTTFVEPATPFGNWDMETVINWLNDLGLQGCAVEARRWVRRGQQLLDAAPSELEKELALKNPLHKKKLLLALEAKGRPINDMLRPFGSPLSNPAMDVAAGKLDHNWVVRWLDDVGLPQYKDLFMESRVDGRVLHNLTVDDLCSFLKVTNLLHLTSVKRGIQVLRNNNFSPDCLVRRPLPEEANQPITAAQVALWTNHRVMEWLRTVDLSEYAPNLRGSGVHGALMVYEPKFTAELLATILSIPAGKTLLRRHLTTHFKELVGKDVMQEKREVETEPGYTPITPLVKAKVVKRGQFTLKRRKSKSEFDSDELVCPLDTSASKNESIPSPKI